MGELMNLSSDLNVITAEINSYKNMAGQAIFEIGRRLEYAKENLFKTTGYGNFDSWCNNDIGMTRQTVNRFIKAHQELGTTSFQLGSSKVFEILQLPDNVDKKEFAETTHTIPSTGEQKTVDEMTVRELREVKKALKDAEEAQRQAELKAQQAKKSEEIAIKRLEAAENKPPKIVERVIEDETKIQKLQQELKRLDQEKRNLETKMKFEQKDAESYRQLKNDLENLRSKRDDMVRQIDNAGTIGKFIARIEKSFEEDLAPIKYIRAIEELHNSKPVLEALDGIVSRVEKWCKEIRLVMPKENYIDAEVIDYE